MRLPRIRSALPWLIALSLLASLGCLVLAVYLGVTARSGAVRNASRDISALADELARQIEGDLALFDLALHEASAQGRPRDADPAAAKASFPELPLTARYLGFMNVLNEVGDVVADSRTNVSRPVNFAGRDYFQDHLKNPADIVMIGRPFATAPNQHPSIPISRRLNRPDGSFAGVVVAGVHLAWLSDLLSQPSPGPRASVTIHRDDGLILTRTPFDPDAIGRGGSADPAWQAWLRTGLSPGAEDLGGIRLFRRLSGAPLVLELTMDSAEVESLWPVWLALSVLIPGLCVLGLSLAAHRLLWRGDRIEAAARLANDERMRLLANMSHELRTPLTGILGQAELMAEEGGLSDRQTTRLTRLTEAGTLMRNIVNRVIDFARPDNRTEKPVATACDLDPLIRTCLGIVEGQARAKGVHLIASVDPSAPARAMLARDQVQQTLINLLMNAVNFTSHGTVTLRVTGDNTRLRFEVADTGRGIQRANRRRLFRAYDRLDTPAAPVEGTGLGLSITERLVHDMDGRIGYAENPGGGSVFWVELPTPDLDQPAPAVRPREPPPEIRHLRILLADDMELTRTVTADYLRSAGHLVTEVPDGEGAIAAAQKHDFDVIMTDMRMPVVDGLEVTRRIRAQTSHRGRTPVVLVTADFAAIGRGESGQTGVDVCVAKPFTRAELLAAVATAARLAPVPDVDPKVHPVLDEAALGALGESLGAVAFAMHLTAATRRIEELRGLLERSDAAESATVRDAAHDLVGVAGLLGLKALSACLRRFDIARDRAAPALTLHEACEFAVRELRRYQGAAGISPD